jgi:uncharacterized protein YuzE
MKPYYLEITYRKGIPVAGYLYLPRQEGDRAERTRRFPDGLLVDYASDGRAIGVEITAPRQLTLEALNHTLAAAHLEPAAAEDIAPLLAA